MRTVLLALVLAVVFQVCGRQWWRWWRCTSLRPLPLELVLKSS